MSEARGPAFDEEKGWASGTRALRRKNISRACEECRRRRAKCDGRKPSCSRCVDRVITCRYSAEEDGRRPAPKTYVQLLRNRIDLLERVLRSHSINVDASIAQLMMTDKTTSTNWTAQEPDALHGGSLPGLSGYEDMYAAFEGVLSLDESLNFDQDGEVRYFGLTSGRLEFQSPNAVNSSNSPDLSSGSVLQDMTQLGSSRAQFNRLCQDIVNEDDVPADLQSHLIDLYFEWEQPWCQVVDERLFKASRESNGRYYSPLLLNCILCIGCRHSDRLDLRSDPNDPNTAGKLFLEKAEVLLHYDLKSPTITTIQSLSIMGTIYVAIGSDAAGWLHQGMANRLALDMGLNLDSASVAGSNWMPIEEVELRRQIYWSLYCVDKLSASYTGRVCTFLDSQGVVALPSVSSSFGEYEKNTGSSYPALSPRGGFDVTPIHTALIALCRNLEKILLTLYAPKPLLHGPQKISFFTSCILELKNWFYDLPSEFRIDRPTSSGKSPHVYTVHMVYHTSFILLMKPLLGKSRDGGRPRAGSGMATDDEMNNIVQKASKICYESARKICTVAKEYRRVFGSFRRSPLSATHCTLSAALVLMNAQNIQGERVEGINYPDIEVCLTVLEELAVSWNPARRIWQNLTKMYHQIRDPKPDSPETTRVSEERENSSTSALSRNHDQIGSWQEDPQGVEGNESEVNLIPEAFDTEVQDMIDDAFLNGLAFPLDSLPSDYEDFGTLNRWHLDNTW